MKKNISINICGTIYAIDEDAYQLLENYLQSMKNYFRNDDPDEEILFRWRSHANLLFSNWLTYYLYQATPYNLDDLRDGKEDAWREAFKDDDSIIDD